MSADTKGDVDIEADAGTKFSVLGNGEVLKSAQSNAAGVQSSMEGNVLETTVSKEHLGRITIKKDKVEVKSSQCSGNCNKDFGKIVKEEVSKEHQKGFAQRMLNPAAAVQKFMLENGVKGMMAEVDGKEETGVYEEESDSAEDAKTKKNATQDVDKDLAKLKEKFVGAMQSLKSKVVSSKAFIAAKKVYTESKERLKVRPPG